MAAVEFHGDSLASTEQFLTRHYTTMQIENGSDSVPVRSHIVRETLGEVALDQLDLGFDMAYDADPLGKICLCVVDEGWIEGQHLDQEGRDIFGPGEIGLLMPPHLPYNGVIHRARCTLAIFDPDELTRVAGSGPQDGAVELIGHHPVSQAAGHTLTATITHLRGLAAAQPAGVSPLVTATATQFLAAAVLAAFPNTADGEPTAADSHDAHPATLRRALAYMESCVHDDIAVADIAASSYVTVRALQLAFRRHLNTTPTAYLTRMRLRGAHEQLSASSPDQGATVAAIAAEWGFAHPGRFAARYRGRYGRSPATTLIT